MTIQTTFKFTVSISVANAAYLDEHFIACAIEAAIRASHPPLLAPKAPRTALTVTAVAV
jgi:hypothetical protein